MLFASPNYFLLTCDTTWRQVQDDQLYRIDPLVPTLTTVGGPAMSPYNALGYNTSDDYLYALFSGTYNLVKMGMT